jgi:trans-2,3-dihydro-3-hydroxyanthranilate isomerase
MARNDKKAKQMKKGTNKECLFLDVFTDKAYAGNQLAVFPDGEGLTSKQMQMLAREINYSETTFVFQASKAGADFSIRIFTPKAELPFGGHPVLGTAYAIMNILDIWPVKKTVLKLKMKVGVIPLEKLGGNIWMTQKEPQFFKTYADKKYIASLVNLTAEDISDDLPMEEVSTGNKVLIVPVKSLAAVQRASGDTDKLIRFYEESGTHAPYIFTRETVNKRAKIHSRFFAPHLGIIEDAATGSAAGPLTGYLLKHKVFGKSFEILNEQGLEMGRPSKILMSGEVKGGKYIIKIGGTCAYAGKGSFVI